LKVNKEEGLEMKKRENKESKETKPISKIDKN